MLWCIVQSQPGGTETYGQINGPRWQGTCRAALLQPVPTLANTAPWSLPWGRVFKSRFNYDLDLGAHLTLSLPLLGHHPSDLELVEDNRSSSSVPPPVWLPTPIAARGFCPSAKEQCIWCIIWCILSGKWSRECSWQDPLKVSWVAVGQGGSPVLGQACLASAVFCSQQPARWFL